MRRTCVLPIVLALAMLVGCSLLGEEKANRGSRPPYA